MAIKKDLHFAIIGGGISGLTLAIALHQRGVSVTVYEQSAKFREIGAGVSFTPNAVEAMTLCHPGIYEAFEKVRTRNVWPSKQNVWFDYYDGYHETPGNMAEQRPAFSISNQIGQNAVHRADYLDELVKLIPPEITCVGKRLESISDNESGTYTLTFSDGSTAAAHAVLGCDGIKSRVRQLMFGTDHPCASPTYSYKYAYRALVPMQEAIQALGEEKAQNACMHMGPGGHMLTFPIQHGEVLNVVAFHTAKEDWQDYHKLTAAATREDVLRDFAEFGSSVTKVLKMVKPNLDMWAIFHLGDNPCPYFAEGRTCLLGDAAHATSPHHGAGAGMCIEDSAVLADLLADEHVQTSRDVELALSVYDSVRRERGQWLVQSSRRVGDCYEWLADGVGGDFKKIEAEINLRNGVIANVDVAAMCTDAKDRLRKKLASVNRT